MGNHSFFICLKKKKLIFYYFEVYLTELGNIIKYKVEYTYSTKTKNGGHHNDKHKQKRG